MTRTPKFSITLAIIVIGFYLGLTYLPQIAGTCMDGECGFSVVEILLSFSLPLAFIALPVVLEMVLYHKGLMQALNDIGITRFNRTGIYIAVLYLLPMAVFFPILSLLTNALMAVRPGWEWLLINIILVNGFAEEILMRGFVFRHLRKERSFWQAAALSTVYFAAYHLPLILSQGVIIGSIAVVIAIPLGFLAAYTYERGTSTIWGPGLLHIGNNGLVMLIVLPADVQPAASALYILLGIAVSTVMLVWAYRVGYGRSSEPTLAKSMALNS
jgi:membrane protease YdiL (CAAX protease family)